MQIQYCDDCGTRVDDSEITTIAGKIYCKNCAKNHAPQEKAVGTGVYTGQRSSTRVSRLTRTPTPNRGGTKITDTFNPAFPEPAADEEYQDNMASAYAAAPAPSWIQRNRALAISLAAGAGGV